MQYNTREGRSQAKKTIIKALYNANAYKPTVMNISVLHSVAEVLMKTVIIGGTRRNGETIVRDFIFLCPSQIKWIKIRYFCFWIGWNSWQENSPTENNYKIQINLESYFLRHQRTAKANSTRGTTILEIKKRENIL